MILLALYGGSNYRPLWNSIVLDRDISITEPGYISSYTIACVPAKTQISLAGSAG